MHTVRNLDKGIWRKFVVYCKLEDVKVADELNKILKGYLKKHFKIKKMNEIIILLSLFFIIMLFQTINVKANTYLWENSTWQGDLTGVQYVSQVVGDLDGNGFQDLILIGNSAGTPVSKVYTNNGTGLTDNSTWSSNLTALHYGSIALGDIDNDADLDLILTGCINGNAGYASSCGDNNEKSFVYTNNGSSFIENRTFKADITDVYKGSIALGDVDNDGKLDLVLTGGTTTGVISKVYINNGTGFAENSTWQIDLTAIDASAVVLGDIDNDNNLDLIISGEDVGNSKHTEVYINNGSSFARNTTWDANLVAVGDSSLSLGDFDSDGDLDLTLIGCCDKHRIYNNTGSTFLTSQKESTSGGNLGGLFAGSISLGDYDNDGDLDMITSGREKATFLYTGYGDGNFTSYSEDPESGIANLIYSSVAWSDLDNDSDLDLILFGWNVDVYAYVYTNSITIPNSKPEAPNSSFSSTFDDGKLILEWGNGSDAETSALGLYYNIRVGTSSEGNDVISGIYGGGDDNGYFGNMMQRKSISIKGLDASTDYYWSVQTIDTGLKKSNWSAEQSYTTADDIINPTIEYIFPANNYYSNKNYVHFGANVTDETDLANVSLYGDWTGSLTLNQTNSTGNNGNHTFNVSLNDGTYSFYIQACDATGNCAESSTRTFYVDTTYPNINLTYPSNGTIWGNSSNVTFTYNVSDISIVNCSLIINDRINQTDDSVSVNILQNFTKAMSNGNYNWSVNCTDNVDQLNNSETWKLTVDYTAPSVSEAVSEAAVTTGGGSAARVAAAEAIRAKSPVKEKSIPRVWDKIKKDEIKKYEVKKEEISISEIIFDVKEDTTQAEVSVNSLKSVPNPITKTVYQYLEINTKNIDTKEAKIRFNVEKKWVNENNIDKDTIKLNRFVDKWNELDTKEISEISNYVIYESISPGFSYFAVTGENKTIKEVEKVLEKEEKILEKEKAIRIKQGNPVIWIAAMFLFLLVWYYYFTKYVTKKKK